MTLPATRTPTRQVRPRDGHAQQPPEPRAPAAGWPARAPTLERRQRRLAQRPRRASCSGGWRCYALTLLALLLLGAAAAETAATAQTAPAPMQLDLDAYLVVLEERDGEHVEVLQPALEVAPGALLEWWLRARNDASQELAQVALDLPIPDGTAFVSGSAWLALLQEDGSLAPAEDVAHALEYSADDGATFATEPLVRTVTREDGETVEEHVPPVAYTHVRARIDSVPADATLVLVARTSVR